MKCKTIALLLV